MLRKEPACREGLIIMSSDLGKFLIFFKIRPSLTTSKEGLKTLNIHIGTTSLTLD